MTEHCKRTEGQRKGKRRGNESRTKGQRPNRNETKTGTRFYFSLRHVVTYKKGSMPKPKGAVKGQTVTDEPRSNLAHTADGKATAAAAHAVAKAPKTQRETTCYTTTSYVHPSMFATLIGKDGSVIKRIREKINVAVRVLRDAPHHNVMLAGSKARVELAKEVIASIVTFYHHEVTHPGQIHLELDVPPSKLGRLIGRAGCELQHIQSRFQVLVHIPSEFSANRHVVIVGTEAAAACAKAYVSKLLNLPQDAQILPAAKPVDRPFQQAKTSQGERGVRERGVREGWERGG